MSKRWSKGDFIKRRWEVKDIYEGGMGIIYIVQDHDPEFDEIFAVKTFHPEKLKEKKDLVARFFEEAKAWISLDVHDNIVTARLVEEIDGNPCLFLEYIDGPNLESYIGMSQLADLSSVARFSINICDGMLHALSKGIKAHRDIKPSNCLIDEFGTLKVTDFGLAKVIGARERQYSQNPLPRTYVGFTTRPDQRGTIHYMPPEQFDDFSRGDVRGDVYSFGIMLYQMLTAELPFEGQSDKEFEQLHKNAPVPQLTDKHVIFADVVNTCLAKNPDDRYQDFQALRDDLAGIYRQLTEQEAPVPARGPELDFRQVVNKGASFFALKVYDEALKYTNNALEIRPNSSRAYCNRGAILDAMGRLDEAMDSLRRALIHDSKDDKSWINRALILRKRGRQEEALRSFQTARSLRKDKSDYWYYEGLMLNEMGSYSDAIYRFRNCVRLNSNDADAWALLGGCYRAVGNDTKADECYRTADQLLGGNTHLSRILELRKKFFELED
jgi:serine/threonine protein kinase